MNDELGILFAKRTKNGGAVREVKLRPREADDVPSGSGLHEVITN
jgi:hypothetical protein